MEVEVEQKRKEQLEAVQQRKAKLEKLVGMADT